MSALILTDLFIGSYEWEDENGTWSLYNHSVQRLLYAASLYKLSQVSFPEKGQKYTIDFKKMEQSNMKSKVKRKVRAGGENNKENSNKISAANDEQKVATSSSRPTRKMVKKEEPTNREFEEKVEEVRKISEGNSKSRNKTENSKELVRLISFKGKIPVDVECFAREKYHVYYEGDTVYDAMLNQTNLKNNNNKFYLMQILQTDANNSYAVWYRWGRVGLIGQSNLTNCGNDLEKAKEMFCKK